MQSFESEPFGTQPEPGSEQPEQPAPTLLPAKLPLMRPKQGRMVAGVARGISLHLGVPVIWIRLCFVALTCWFGVGAFAYVALWILIPEGDPHQQAARLRAMHTDRNSPLAKGNTPIDANGVPLFTQQTLDAEQNSWYDYTGLAQSQDSESMLGATKRTLSNASKPAIIAAVGLALIAIAALMSFNERFAQSPYIPAMLCLLGVGIAWMNFHTRSAQVRATAIGEALIFVAFFVFVIQSSLQTGAVPLPRALLSGLALLLAAICAIIPWMLTLIRNIGKERALKEREEERADMTAHLHDGVLQTLALIQLHANDEQQVFTLARSQERELRNWLYQERTTSDRSVNAGLQDIAAQVEDTHGKPIDVVTVGDARPSAQTDALLDAAKQAMVNAVTHGDEPISVYCEANANNVDLFVRDHGQGFDVNAIPEERLGIRESIIGRIKRRGGTVEIVSRPNWGTEVRMHMPLQAEPAAQQSSQATPANVAQKRQ